MARDLEGVKVGDIIKVNERYGSGFTLHEVERVTATRAVCGNAIFMIESGLQVGTRSGGRWPTSKYGTLVRDAAELKEIKAAHDLKRRINVANARVARITVTDDNLEAAEAFIAASQAKKEGA